MSSVDDILFEPIGSNKAILLVDQEIIDAVRVSLSGICGVEFTVDSGIPLTIYDTIADLIENDSQICTYTTAMARRDSTPSARPPNALTIHDIFHRMHAGQDVFYFSGRSNGAGITKHRFTNWFGIDTQIPIVHVEDIDGSNPGYFEWWILGLMSKFIGYQQYYAFANEVDARKYYGMP